MVFISFKQKVKPVSITPETSPEVLVKKTPKSFRENVDRRSIVLGIKEESQVRLEIEKKLFSRTGDSVPIITTDSAGSVYRDLQVRGNLFASGDLVLEDADSQKAVVIVERKFSVVSNTFNIYCTRPVYSGQRPAQIFKYNQRLYSFGEVKRRGSVLNVVLEGRSEPTYTIHKRASKSDSECPTTYTIKKREDVVASARSEVGHSNMLTVEAGADPCLMICLTAIAEDAYKHP